MRVVRLNRTEPRRDRHQRSSALARCRRRNRPQSVGCAMPARMREVRRDSRRQVVHHNLHPWQSPFPNPVLARNASCAGVQNASGHDSCCALALSLASSLPAHALRPIAHRMTLRSRVRAGVAACARCCSRCSPRRTHARGLGSQAPPPAPSYDDNLTRAQDRVDKRAAAAATLTASGDRISFRSPAATG